MHGGPLLGGVIQVYDAAFSPPEQNTIVVVGDQFIKFAQLGGRALKFRNGILRSGRKRQKFICVTYVGPDAVVGCASGELYRFQNRWCVQNVQAHSVCEPVLSLHWSGKHHALVRRCSVRALTMHVTLRACRCQPQTQSWSQAGATAWSRRGTVTCTRLAKAAMSLSTRMGMKQATPGKYACPTCPRDCGI